MNDWDGNKNACFSTIGATNHSKTEREVNDYYATDPKAIDSLLSVEMFNKKIWEPAAGELHLSNRLEQYGYNVRSTDLIIRNRKVEQLDFLSTNEKWDGDIITNPPYKYAQEFVEHSLNLIKNGNKVAMFLKLTFLEGKKRRKMFDENPPAMVHVFSSRITCAKNGDFGSYKSSPVAYAWFVWIKGKKDRPIISWL